MPTKALDAHTLARTAPITRLGDPTSNDPAVRDPWGAPLWRLNLLADLNMTLDVYGADEATARTNAVLPIQRQIDRLPSG